MAEDALSNLELEHVIGFTGRHAHTLHFHPTTPHAVIYPIGSVVILANTEDPHHQEFLRGHDAEIKAIVVSPSGKLLASGQVGSAYHKESAAPVIVWDFDAESKPRSAKVFVLHGVTIGIVCMAFSPDDAFLAVAGDDCKFMIFDMNNGQLVTQSKTDRQVTCMVWSYTAQTVTSRAGSKRPSYLLISTVADKVRVQLFQYELRSLQYEMSSQDVKFPSAGMVRGYHVAAVRGDFLVLGTNAGECFVFDLKNLIYRSSIQVSSGGVLSLCVKGETLFAGCGDGKVKRLSGRDLNWTEEASAQLSGKVSSLTLSGDELLAGTSAGKIYRLDPRSMRSVLVAESHVGAVNHVSFGLRNEFFATVSSDSGFRVWDLGDYMVRASGNGPCPALCCLFTDEESIVSGWQDGFVRGHSAKSGERQWELPNAHRGGVTTLACTLQVYLTGGEDGIIRIWSRRSREFLGQFSEHTKPVTGLLVDHAQSHLVHSSSADKTVVTIDLKAERRCMVHMTRDFGFTSLTQRKEHELELVTADVDGRVLFWDCDIADAVQKWQDPSRLRINLVSVSPSGKYLLLTSDDYTVKVLSVSNLAVIAVGRGHSSRVTHAQWSPDEKQIISVSTDASICVWNFYAA